jgi:NAD(P)H-flavin reductase
MPFSTYTAKLTQRRDFNETFFQLYFELMEPNRLEFKSGQYVLLNVPGEGKKKSYSICSSPQTQHAIELLIDSAPDGPGSRYLKALKVGETITFMAPFGNFVLPPVGSPLEQAETSLAFVATGSGIAPMPSFLDDLLVARGDKRPITLYWGLRYAEDQFWYEEFSEMAQIHPNFRFHPVLSRAPEEWPLCRGRVTDCLTVHAQAPNTGYYLCGSSAMIDDVSAILAKQGVLKEHIHHERFN